MVRPGRVELPQISPPAPQTGASTIPPRPHNKFKWWPRRDLHPHAFRHGLLRPACTAKFHHEAVSRSLIAGILFLTLHSSIGRYPPSLRCSPAQAVCVAPSAVRTPCGSRLQQWCPELPHIPSPCGSGVVRRVGERELAETRRFELLVPFKGSLQLSRLVP